MTLSEQVAKKLEKLAEDTEVLGRYLDEGEKYIYVSKELAKLAKSIRVKIQ